MLDHSPDGKCHNQTDNVLVRKRLRSELNIQRTTSFPKAYKGSDFDLSSLSKEGQKANQAEAVQQSHDVILTSYLRRST